MNQNCPICSKQLFDNNLCNQCGYELPSNTEGGLIALQEQQIRFAKRQWEHIQMLEAQLQALQPTQNKGTRAFETFFAHFFKPVRLGFLKNILVKLPSPQQIKGNLPELWQFKKRVVMENTFISSLENMPAVKIQQLLRRENVSIPLDGIQSFQQVDFKKIIAQQKSMTQLMIVEEQEKVKILLEHEREKAKEYIERKYQRTKK